METFDSFLFSGCVLMKLWTLYGTNQSGNMGSYKSIDPCRGTSQVRSGVGKRASYRAEYDPSKIHQHHSE